MTPRGHEIHVCTNGLNKIAYYKVWSSLLIALTGMNYRLLLRIGRKKKRTFMDRFFCFLLRTKSVLRLKNRSRTGKTDDFSSPACNITDNFYVNNAFTYWNNVSTMHLLTEIMFSLEVTKPHFKDSYDKHNPTLKVISYEIYETRQRLVS